MFPLTGVLFPGAVVPLHVFEERYQRLVADIGGVGGTFGVVLIERGSEVGGGDTRVDVGTSAVVIATAPLGGGRLAVTARGRDRIRVKRWLPDDPYPRADVALLDEPEEPNLESRLERCVALRRRVLALTLEMGSVTMPLDVDLPAAPGEAAWALCRAAPMGPFDLQRLLEAESAASRLELFAELLAEQARVLEAALRHQ